MRPLVARLVLLLCALVAPAVGVAATPAPVTGTLTIMHEHHRDGTARYRYLVAPDAPVASRARVAPVPSIEVPRPHFTVVTGDRVEVVGRRALPVRSGGVRAVRVSAAPLAALGSQRVVVLLVNFLDDQSQVPAASDVRYRMALADDFYRENSYQQVSLAVDVFGWYTMPITKSCAYATIKTYADQAAAAAGVNLSGYGKRVYLFPRNSNCLFAGLGTVGGNPASSWINGQAWEGTFIHELGHNFGLWHSHSLNCSPAVIGASCPVVEYGDSFDIMGGGGLQGHFNAFQKARLGWLDAGVSPPITTVVANGTYPLDAYEFPGAGPKALRIPRGTTGESFFVEFRRNVGWDTYLIRTGIFLHLTTDLDPNRSYLLDLTGGTFSMDDAYLDVGRTFTDPLTGITVTTFAASATAATVAVGGLSTPPPPPPGDRDGDGVPDAADLCPDLAGLAPTGCPAIPPPPPGEVATAFTYINTGKPQTFTVPAPPYACVRLAGGSRELRILFGTAIRGRVTVDNPNPKGETFTIACLVTATQVRATLTTPVRAVTLTVPR